jgi:hypothetical protein
MKHQLIAGIGLALLGIAKAAYFDDKVDYLPGMGEFKKWGLYSGYLDIKGSPRNFFTGRHLHYVLA